jgi:hypothetical protein
MSKYYTEDDSREVMDVLYSKLKEQNNERQPMICTQKEYETFEDAGCDMTGYMTIQQMEKIVRDQYVKELRDNRFIIKKRTA